MAQVPASIVTRNMADFADQTGNVYESVAIISKRANQISVKIKEELNSKLAEFATTVDNLE
ncbi:MAG: DNA-directed RNA polymerase subunit omega, partial [Adhaeribacter sp.]